MSFRSAFLGIGSFIGITIGGSVLNTFNYQAVGIALGTISFASIIIVLLIAKDPWRSKLRV
jgi:predicted MFS family arabinose efflux permease